MIITSGDCLYAQCIIKHVHNYLYPKRGDVLWKIGDKRLQCNGNLLGSRIYNLRSINLTNREALTGLCSVVKHAGSGYCTKEV